MDSFPMHVKPLISAVALVVAFGAPSSALAASHSHGRRPTADARARSCPDAYAHAYAGAYRQRSRHHGLRNELRLARQLPPWGCDL